VSAAFCGFPISINALLFNVFNCRYIQTVSCALLATTAAQKTQYNILTQKIRSIPRGSGNIGIINDTVKKLLAYVE
jgi:hypothetical protein